MNFISSNNFDESLNLDEEFNLDKKIKLNKSILSLGEPFFYFIKIIEFPNQIVVSKEEVVSKEGAFNKINVENKITNERKKREIYTHTRTKKDIKEYKPISPELNKFKKPLCNISLSLSSNKEDIFSFIDNLKDLKLEVISNKNLINSNLEFIEYSNFLVKRYKPDLILNLTSNSCFPYISNLIKFTNPSSISISPSNSHYRFIPSTFSPLFTFTFKEIEIDSFSYEEQLLVNLSILYQCLGEIN